MDVDHNFFVLTLEKDLPREDLLKFVRTDFEQADRTVLSQAILDLGNSLAFVGILEVR